MAFRQSVVWSVQDWLSLATPSCKEHAPSRSTSAASRLLRTSSIPRDSALCARHARLVNAEQRKIFFSLFYGPPGWPCLTQDPLMHLPIRWPPSRSGKLVNTQCQTQAGMLEELSLRVKCQLPVVLTATPAGPCLEADEPACRTS